MTGRSFSSNPEKRFTSPPSSSPRLRAVRASHHDAPPARTDHAPNAMAAHYQEEVHVQNECENCGATEDLALCSRCHTAHFCSRKCQKAYWPFHREWCRRNDFADEVERTQPKFARFLRKHGKQAVLKDGACEPRLGERRARLRNPRSRLRTSRRFVPRFRAFARSARHALPKPFSSTPTADAKTANVLARSSPRRATDEVDRLERKVVSMPSMYGRANPKPEPPSYDAEDMRKMRDAEEKDLLRARAAEASAAARGSGAFASSLADASAAWAEIDVPCGLGDAASDTVKWRQNQTFVEVFVALPDPARGRLTSRCTSAPSASASPSPASPSSTAASSRRSRPRRPRGSSRTACSSSRC